MRFFSPAKLNLFFRVLRKRADGYHEIISLVAPVSLGDDLDCELSDQDELSCNLSSLPTGRENLIWKAVDLFRKETGLSFFVRIALHKRIPVGAGLGGGSGNAATALWAINQLCNSPLTLDDLKKLGGEISSDVNLFFASQASLCQGRGERVEQHKISPLRNLWIAKPAESLSTPLVYRHCIPDQLPSRSIEEVVRSFSSKEPLFFNDLEEAAFSLVPSLALLKQQLFDAGFSRVTMTGSGTAFFCIGETPSHSLPGVEFFPVSLIERSEEKWWSEQPEESALIL